jgi:glycosyltransferase involved in cell wall biosynthesis
MTPRILVDHSRLGTTITGIERITLELFSGEALAPLELEPVTGGSTLRMMLAQQIGLPARLIADRKAVVLCPAFPPSIPLTLMGGRRVVPYIHDCFLITRPQDLNWRARAYMVPAFRKAVSSLPWFLVNSETTASELRRFCRPDAEISLYRPRVRDVFGVAGLANQRTLQPGGRLDLLALGTVEPRKNLVAAADIVACLRDAHGFDARLHVIGRIGWGGEDKRLAGRPGVEMHGYLDIDGVRAGLAGAHALISTSFDEGLGLPLLEAQHAGLPIIAPEGPVFTEALAGSGLHIDPAKPAEAAAAIAAFLTAPDAFTRGAAASRANVERWNTAADADRSALVERLLRFG